MRMRALAWVVAVLASLAVHLAFASIFVTGEESPMIAGGGESSVAVLGSAFEDMAIAGAPSPTVSPDAEPDTLAADEPDIAEPDIAKPDLAEPQRVSPSSEAQEVVAAAPVQQASQPALPQISPQEAVEAVRAERPDEALPVVVAALEPAESPSREEVVASAPASTLEAEPAETREPGPDAEPVQPQAARESIAPREPPIETVQPIEKPAETVEPLEEPAVKQVALPLPPAPREKRKVVKPAKEPARKTKQEPVRRKAKRPPASSGGAGNADRDARRGSDAAQASNGSAGESATRNSGAPGNAAVSNYPGLVASKLRRSLRYPAQARRRHLRGEVHVSFIVSRKGAARSIRIARSSGSEILDSAALETVRRAAPFPAIPDAAGKSSWPFTVPLAFTR